MNEYDLLAILRIIGGLVLLVLPGLIWLPALNDEWSIRRLSSWTFSLIFSLLLTGLGLMVLSALRISLQAWTVAGLQVVLIAGGVLTFFNKHRRTLR